jgi:hypothetical protein
MPPMLLDNLRLEVARPQRPCQGLVTSAEVTISNRVVSVIVVNNNCREAAQKSRLSAWIATAFLLSRSCSEHVGVPGSSGADPPAEPGDDTE